MKVIYCDGSRTRWLFYDETDGLLHSEPNPDGASHNASEYLAILAALGHLKPNEDAIILSDSLLAISQIAGKWKVKQDTLRSLCREAQRKIRELHGIVSLQWISRKDNLAGWLLEKDVCGGGGSITIDHINAGSIS